MTAAFAPADQTTFQPRSISHPSLQVVRPLADAIPAEPEQLATVHQLPVRHQAGVYRRRRLVALAVIVGVLLGIVSFMQQADATPTPEGQLAEAVTVIVQPGDTLWGIAADLDPASDPRGLVDQLTELAGGSQLQPGQQLIVPAHWLD